ncbi:alginate O-acetyltransferase [Marinobacter alexandrii]|uniref:alginate O-acetyltransferase n=1 Tax=Marinobacter alexandrii TaxID=2570351 RepID=UPI001FFE615D|nr:alginate O-acetyltransferase [Marinobacter alexandrii]MCK2150369.1 alginate O-acetyltransferase [Marinobacter alexandrii]
MITTSRKITACVFIAIVLGLGVMSLRSLGDYSPMGSQDQGLDPVNGELARDVESHYDDGFPVRELGTNLWAAINYTLFREGRPGVTVGEQGWLFTDEELFLGAETPAVIDRNLERVQAVAEHLRSEGVPLALLVVPSKARLYSEKLGDLQPVPEMRALYQRFLTQMQPAPVVAPDLLPNLADARFKGTQVFLRTDTHWTPAGADVFARSAATAIQQAFSGQAWGDTEFKTSLGETRKHEGDLLTYLPLEPLFPDLGPDPETVTERSTAPADDGSTSAESLFAETTADVVLVGTSYSANPLWDFPGALKRHLGRDLINVSDEGQGPFQPMTEYLRSDEFRNHPPELVIWEFPERYLAQPVQSEATLAWFERRENLLAQGSGPGRPSMQ